MDYHHHAALSRMFNDPRGLQPWNPEHALFIAGELAKLKITDKKDYEVKKAFYDQKLAGWNGTPDDPIDKREVVPQHTNFNNLPLPEFVKEEVKVEEVEAPIEEVVGAKQEKVKKTKKHIK